LIDNALLLNFDRFTGALLNSCSPSLQQHSTRSADQRGAEQRGMSSSYMTSHDKLNFAKRVLCQAESVRLSVCLSVCRIVRKQAAVCRVEMQQVISGTFVADQPPLILSTSRKLLHGR